VDALRTAMADLDDLHFARAPGRVNLIGDHTDYNDGLVLPFAIDRECLVAWRARDDPHVAVRSLDLAGAVVVAADGRDDPAAIAAPAWGRFVAGVVRALARRGRPATGLDAVISSSVPAGSGLSSSAALEIALATALVGAAPGFELPPHDLARVGQEAEHLATGIPSGLMDQLAAVFGRADHALFIDCRSLELESVPLPAALTTVVVHSGLPRTLASSAYADRRRECAAAAAALDVASLRDARPDQVRNLPRARHVVSENARVLEAVTALRAADGARLGRLLGASHASLRDDYEVSTPELDLLVGLLVAQGALGARLTGAGFGGCVIALVESTEAQRIADTAVRRYRDTTGLEPSAFIARAVDGVGGSLI